MSDLDNDSDVLSFMDGVSSRVETSGDESDMSGADSGEPEAVAAAPEPAGPVALIPEPAGPLAAVMPSRGIGSHRGWHTEGCRVGGVRTQWV